MEPKIPEENPRIEKAQALAAEICDKCRWPFQCDSQEALDAKCAECGLSELCCMAVNEK